MTFLLARCTVCIFVSIFHFLSNGIFSTGKEIRQQDSRGRSLFRGYCPTGLLWLPLPLSLLLCCSICPAFSWLLILFVV
jgi:hypothetical protein